MVTTTRYKHPIRLVATAAVFLIAAATTQAGPITWQVAQNTASATDVIAVGDLIEAFNATSTDSGEVIVNGVAFTNTKGLLGNNVSPGFLAGNSSGNAQYDELLNSLDFGGGTDPTSLSIGGGKLQSGMSYWVQVWFTDLRPQFSSRTMKFGDGESPANTVSLLASGSGSGGLGQFAIGGFTASGASQTLTLQPDGFGNSHITAYQVRAQPSSLPVPLPAPLALLAVGLLAMGARLRAQ